MPTTTNHSWSPAPGDIVKIAHTPHNGHDRPSLMNNPHHELVQRSGTCTVVRVGTAHIGFTPVPAWSLQPEGTTTPEAQLHYDADWAVLTLIASKQEGLF